MKRLFVALTVLVLAALAALTIRWTVSPDLVRGEIESRLARWLDRPIVLTGAAELTLLPRPALRWSRATLAVDATAAPFARADEIVADLSPAGLLLGRAEIAGLTVHRPDLRLDLAPPALDGWRTRAATLPPLDLSVDGGRLTLVGADGRPEVLEAIDATLTWPRGATRSEIALTARWHDALFSLAVTAPSPDDLVAARPARLAVDLRAPHLSARFDGTLVVDAEPRLDGDLTLALADPPRFADWLGRREARDLLAGPVSIDGRLLTTGLTATLAAARVDLAGARATGVLSLSPAGREPLLGATLAFDTIDLRGDRAALFGDGWRRIALDRDRLPLALDLRLSARRWLGARLSLDKIAAALHFAEGRLVAEIGEVSLWDRPMSLILRGETSDDGLRADIAAQARDLPADRLAALFGITGIEDGAIGVDLEGSTRCARLWDCVLALQTRSRLVGRDLVVTGPSPFGDVTRFHPIVVAPKAVTRTSTWPRADVALRTAGRAVTFDAVELTGETARFALTGTGDLEAGTLDLAGRALFPHFRPGAARSGSDGILIPIRVRGPLGSLETTAGRPELPAPQPTPPPEVAPPSPPTPTADAPAPDAPASEARAPEASPAAPAPPTTGDPR